VGEAFAEVSKSMTDLINTFYPQAVVGDTTVGLTVYTVWMIIAAVVCVAVLLVFTKKQSESMVPHGVIVNGIEYLIEFVENDIAKAMLGDTWRKHFPFLATLFFFVLFGNYIGMLPTWRPGTGSTGVTGAIALMSFIYFIYVGIRKKGLWGYVKSLAPSGIMLPIRILVWIIEVFSTFLRLITLAVRLFCNMFAGHVVMGTFAIMCSIFLDPLINGAITAQAVGTGAMSILWMLLLLMIYGVELMIAFIQAYIFTLLSAVYINGAEADSD
jgi:F-type H+-transporting ATPase subunit a